MQKESTPIMSDHEYKIHLSETHQYDDIIHQPHHTSTVHARMSVLDRAAQFSPFAALTGYEAAIEETGRLTDAWVELEWLDKVLAVVNYMENSKVWKDKIVQITVCDGGELKMVPRRGQEVFLFGQPVNIEDKFRRMEMYYSNIIPAKGQVAYTSVSVEYDGQIVCK